MKDYVISVGDALSQLINSAIFFSGNANQSLSGRCWVEKENWFFGSLRFVIDAVFWVFEKEHCKKAYYSDLARAEKLLQNHYDKNLRKMVEGDIN